MAGNDQVANTSLPDDMVYPTNAKTRGYVCLFLNQEFRITDDSEPFEVREGAEICMNQLREVFQDLRFIPREFNDLSREEILSNLDGVLAEEVLSEHDCFVAIFSSHGNQSLIYDKYYDPLSIDKIMKRFSNSKCPRLINKPKIIVFLCCRGSETCPALELPMDQPGINWDEHEQEDDQEQEREGEATVPIYEDIMILYSTIYNHFSLRHPEEGTFYGKYLAQNLSQYANKRDFDFIVKKTAQDMSSETIDIELSGAQMLMSSTKTIGWRKYLYFN